jgi:magnesium-transporting ATPase (P-type)
LIFFSLFFHFYFFTLKIFLFIFKFIDIENSKKLSSHKKKLRYLYYFLKRIIYEKGIIFYRMSTYDKVLLVEFYQENKNNIVGMCGDGSNDNGAISRSDFGVFIKDKSCGYNTNGFNFVALNNSISSIEILIKIGRSAIVNLYIIIRYVIIYGILQFSTKIILRTKNVILTDLQYFFLDFYTAFITVVLSSV